MDGSPNYLGILESLEGMLGESLFRRYNSSEREVFGHKGLPSGRGPFIYNPDDSVFAFLHGGDSGTSVIDILYYQEDDGGKVMEEYTKEYTDEQKARDAFDDVCDYLRGHSDLKGVRGVGRRQRMEKVSG